MRSQQKHQKLRKNSLVYNNNIPIRKSWGQNFLIDENTINKIIKIINPMRNDIILEIGPGHGALTKKLLLLCKTLHAVEIDPLLYKSLNKIFCEKINLYNEDILKWNSKKGIVFNKIVGNIPYNISSQIIFKFLKKNNWESMTLMLQKELAKRIISKEGTKEYGRISVMVQNLCNVKYNTDISKNVFHPKPKIDSSILTFEKIENIIDITQFATFIRECFKQRRKKLRNNLKNYCDIELLESYKDKRPEEISPKEFLNIYKKYIFELS